MKTVCDFSVFYLDKIEPKGSIVVECGNALLKNGYKLKILNTINFKKSMHYNPFAYVHSEKDILKLVTTLMTNTKGEGSGGDPFWEKSERLLLLNVFQLSLPERTGQDSARFVTDDRNAALSAIVLIGTQHLNQRRLACCTVTAQNRDVAFQFYGKNYSFAPNFDFMFTLHFIASYELECNRHQFFHVVHHITCIQNFYIHREFFLSKIHQVT